MFIELEEKYGFCFAEKLIKFDWQQKQIKLDFSM